MESAKRGLTGWAAATVLISAFLLFQVQPMVSKMILPWFGGGPSVWTTCMLFFQVFLLAGYAYAHALERLPRTRWAGLIHAVLLVVALTVLPILPSDSWKPTDSSQPQWRIVLLLAANVGLPYFLLSASAPLVQAWYSRAFQGHVPYRLYALSNVGSLTALLSYPFVFEPQFDLARQSTLWSLGFGAYALLSGGMALAMARWNLPTAHSVSDAESGTQSDSLSIGRLGLWLLLPAFGSMSLLAATNQICQDVAVVPFLWILPLSLYLITFIICFDAERWYLRRTIAVVTVVLVFFMAALLLPERVAPVLRPFGLTEDELPAFMDSLALEAGSYLLALFLICMLCHGELVRLRPGARHLTLFYLMISAGGALGGLFVALLCPVWFNTFLESDISLMGGALLGALILLTLWWQRERRWASWWIALTAFPCLIVRDLTSWLFGSRSDKAVHTRQEQIFRVMNILQRRRRWTTLWSVLAPMPLLAMLILVALIPEHRERANLLTARRNFYGTLNIRQYGNVEDDEYARRNLHNGRILHGIQFLQPDKRRIPTTYYAPHSGIGLTLTNLGDGPLRVATVGLGTGTIAAYSEQGDYYCFYEINPEVKDIAQTYFTFLSDTKAEVHIELGDARLSMEQQAPQNYDVIALDAFSGDAIPAHLLTLEAFDVYRKHLKPNGVIAVHISNRHLNLQPIVMLIAEHHCMQVAEIHAADHNQVGDSGSDWMLVTNNLEFLKCRAIVEAGSDVTPPAENIRVWTDQYSNLFQILMVREKWNAAWDDFDKWWNRSTEEEDAAVPTETP
jgi:hypothetical protein